MLLSAPMSRRAPSRGSASSPASPVARGRLMWSLNPKFDIFIYPGELEGCPPHMQDFIARYSYPHLEMPGVVIVDSDNGRFMNHSLDPEHRFPHLRQGLCARRYRRRATRSPATITSSIRDLRGRSGTSTEARQRQWLRKGVSRIGFEAIEVLGRCRKRQAGNRCRLSRRPAEAVAVKACAATTGLAANPHDRAILKAPPTYESIEPMMIRPLSAPPPCGLPSRGSAARAGASRARKNAWCGPRRRAKASSRSPTGRSIRPRPRSSSSPASTPWVSPCSTCITEIAGGQAGASPRHRAFRRRRRSHRSRARRRATMRAASPSAKRAISRSSPCSRCCAKPGR